MENQKPQEKPTGLNANQARHKLNRLKRIATALNDEAIGRESENLRKIAAELSAEVLQLEERVAPKLVGKDAALLPVLE
jgi:hypothetical protein